MGRFAGRRANWKKAIVTLSEGQTVAAFDVMDQFLQGDVDAAGEEE